MAGLNLPTIEKQESIVNAIRPAEIESQEMLQKAKKAFELAKKYRYAHLYKIFGFPSDLLFQRNPAFPFNEIIKLKNGDPDAHFWIMRSGQAHRVGKPFRRTDLDFVEMESEAEWSQREKMPRGRYHTVIARLPREGLDPRNHIGVTVIRTDILLPEFLYYVAEYAWTAKVYQRLCHGTLQLQHIRQDDVKCAFRSVLNQLHRPKKYRRNADEKLREAERKFAESSTREHAINLYNMRKRAGDPQAGIAYYDWLYEQALDKDIPLAEPDSRVWVIDDEIYCDECGEEAAAEYDEVTSYALSDFASLDDMEYQSMLIRGHLIDNYSYRNLFELFKKMPALGGKHLRNFDRNQPIQCKSCGDYLKLEHYPALWHEVLEESKKSRFFW